MHGYLNGDFLYIAVPKNGSTSYSKLLEQHNWTKVDLLRDDIDFDRVKIWAHITDPNDRHTRGLSEYLLDNQDIDYKSPIVGKLLVSGVFDEHHYSVHMLMSPFMNRTIHWIPIDHEFVDWRVHPSQRQPINGNDLTNMFFAEHGIDIVVPKNYRLYQATQAHQEIRNHIVIWKETYKRNFQKIMTHFLDADVLLYNSVLDQYRKKFENTTGTYRDR